MPVKITPKDTRGANMPNIPRPLRKVMFGAVSKMIEMRGGHILNLTTVGSKSGNEHTTPLGYFADGKNAWLIVASNGGAAKHPAWYHNMAKNPDKIWIQIGKEKHKVHAESLTGVEREKEWKRVVAESPNYDAYTKQTDREIPLIRLKAV